jgi:hypothetical protein
MEWLLVITIILLALTALYSIQMAKLAGGPRGIESYVDYINGELGGPDGVVPEIADFRQGLPLADMLTSTEKLTELGYGGAYTANKTRQLEIGGQYVQRTNNYRHTYPDNGSTPLNELAGAVYKSSSDIGATVPCDGLC